MLAALVPRPIRQHHVTLSVPALSCKGLRPLHRPFLCPGWEGRGHAGCLLLLLCLPAVEGRIGTPVRVGGPRENALHPP